MEPVGVKRKLSVILVEDVEGYSRLNCVDEEATLETLKTYHEIIDGLIAKHASERFCPEGRSAI